MKFLCLPILLSGEVINTGNKVSKGCNPVDWLNSDRIWNHKKLNVENLLQDVGKIIYQIFGSTNSIDIVNSTRTYKFIKTKTFQRNALPLTKINYKWKTEKTHCDIAQIFHLSLFKIEYFYIIKNNLWHLINSWWNVIKIDQKI